jgi:hypothetical protein
MESHDQLSCLFFIIGSIFKNGNSKLYIFGFDQSTWQEIVFDSTPDTTLYGLTFDNSLSNLLLFTNNGVLKYNFGGKFCHYSCFACDDNSNGAYGKCKSCLRSENHINERYCIRLDCQDSNDFIYYQDNDCYKNDCPQGTLKFSGQICEVCGQKCVECREKYNCFKCASGYFV